MRTYELMMIYRPDLVEADVRAEIARVEATIGETGEVEETDFWGKRRFAYEIDHQHEGYYSVVTFTGEAALVDLLDRSLSLADSVIRHKVLRIDRPAGVG